MKTNKLTMLFSLVLAISGIALQGVEIVRDNYTATNVNAGFALGNGVNSGINPQGTPPFTRITGTSAANLRYLYTQTGTAKSTNSFTIGNGLTANTNRLKVAGSGSSGRFTLSANGTAPFDFAPALGVPNASPTNPSIYEIQITMDNDTPTANGNARFSLGFATAEIDANNWDFGIQLYRIGTADLNYTVQKRINSLSHGFPSPTNINSPIITGGVAGAFGTEVTFRIHVTDAGPESGTNYNSRIEVYIIGASATNLIYDTQASAEVANKWRLDGPGRFISWDIAGNTVATYDNFAVTLISAPSVSQTVWNGGGGDDNWSTGDNWGGVPPITGNSLIFNGTTRQVNVNDIADLIAPSVTFSNGGFALSGLPWTLTTSIANLAGTNTFGGDLSWSTTFPKSWNVASGSEVLLTNLNTVGVNGDHTLSGGGTVHLKGTMNIGQASAATPAIKIDEGKYIVDGGIFASQGNYSVGSLPTGAGAQLILTNGASFTLSSTNTLRVGDSANPITAQLNIDNSTITMGNAILAIPYAAGATSIVNQVGGTVSSASVAFCNGGVGKGTYNIKDGTLETKQIREDSNGSSTISFDNAILRTASGANSTFLSGLNSATIQAGGLVLDATTDVTIAQVLKGTGALVKSNSATVTLTGANTYTGNTKIEGGKLILQTGQNNATTVQVGNGTELVVNLKTAGSTLSVAGLDFNGASSLSFDFGTSANPTAPLIHATSLSVSNTVSVSIANGVLLTTGRIVLIDYDGTFSGDSLFTVGSLPTGMSASITNNTTDGSIDLIITGIPGFLWTGATDSRWNISTTTNWIDQQTASPSAFKEGFLTEFHDGAVTGLVNLEGIITPSFIIVSNDTLPYVWSGGGLTVSSLRKNGTNSLTRVESGADFITDIELNAGSLIVSNIQSATYATVLTDISAGTGTFVKQGPSALTITSTNSTYDGAFIISEGTIKAGADRALGSTNGGTIIANGATLDVNDFQPGFETVIVSGAGVGGAGAIVDTAPGAGSVDANLRDVRMVGDTTLGSPGNTRWDIRVRSGTGPGPGLQGNGFNLTKAGAGFVSIACQRSLTPTPYWDMNLGDVVVNAGTLALAESVTFGNATNHATNTITVNSGAALQLFDLGQTNPILRNIFITDANLNCHGGSAGSNVINSSISLTGAVNFKSDQATFIINGPIIGSGSLAFSAVEPGRLYLNGTNTYPGDTVVTNGGFGGTGSIAGNLVILGGTNSPGMNVGTFTVNGNAALGGTTFMELNRSQSPNSDRLVVGGNLTFAGTLSVVLGAGASAPQAGDVYTLFNKGGTGTFTSVTLPDLSALPGSLSWNTNNLTVNGTISVNGTVASPRIDGVGASGGIFSMSGTGGIEGNSYTILSATNVALPILNWTPLVTNVFGPGGTFGFTNSMDPSAPASFYVLRIP